MHPGRSIRPRATAPDLRRPAIRPSTGRRAALSQVTPRRTCRVGSCVRRRSRFLTRDPLTAVTRSPYAYVNNDPLDGTDPLGLTCFSAHCLLHDVSRATTVIQTGLDVVAVGAAAVGAEPVAGALLGVSEAVGYVNVAPTCADWATGAAGAASGTDCAASVAISVGTVGLGRLVAPGLSRNGKQVFDQVELAAKGSINSFGDLLGWERGRKTGDSSTCPGPPVQPEFRPAP